MNKTKDLCNRTIEENLHIVRKILPKQEGKGNKILGDVVNMENHKDTVKEMGLPITIGYNKDKPKVIDVKEVNNILICGGTGGGKTTLIQSIISQICLLCGKEDTEIIMIDPKRTSTLLVMETLPNINKEVYNEKDISNILNKVKEIVDKRIKNEEKSKSDIILVVDEIELVGDMYDTFIEDIEYIMENSDKTGVKVILIGQRIVSRNISKRIIELTDVKIGIFLQNKGTLNKVFGENAKSKEMINIGDAIIKDKKGKVDNFKTVILHDNRKVNIETIKGIIKILK